MKNKYLLPELLAPAGDFEALRAAVAAGADAVYVGGKRFGARAYAKNFEIDEIKRAVIFCHIRGVRLYVTVNTLIYDRNTKFDTYFVANCNKFSRNPSKFIVYFLTSSFSVVANTIE